jgi:hypothetical protein
MAGRFVYNLVHFVWSTHDRREWIAEPWEDDLNAYLGGIARKRRPRSSKRAEYRITGIYWSLCPRR